MMCCYRVFFAGLTIIAWLGAAGPTAAENVLRYTSLTGGAVTLDPHSSLINKDLAVTKQIYEPLVDIDSDLAIVPQLAVRWKPLNPTTWQFDLRPDVRFHDGTPFRAEDVIFSIERAGAPTANSQLQGYVDGIAAVEAINDYTIRISTAAPDPLLWMKLGQVAIMSKAWAAEHVVITPGDYEGLNEETYASRHANGTGPFIVEAFEPRGRYVLVRNPDWWGTTDYSHNIDRIVHTWMSDTDNLDALLRGEIDLLQAPVFSGLDRIRRSPALKLEHRPKLIGFYLALDQGRSELRSSDVKGRNPFKDRRVRQAIYHAIDIEAVLRSLMGELLIPAGMVIAPGVNGYSPALAERLPYDPKAAKALLVEAGYPDGFSVTLDCPSEWGDDDLTTCRGVAEQLGAVGIEVTVEFHPDEEYISLESDFFLDGRYSDPDSEGLLKLLFHSRSQGNLVGYADPRVDELIGKIKTEMVTYARDAYLEEAWRIVTDDLVYLPVRYGVSVFAMRKTLDIPPDPWDVPRFRLARFIVPSGK